MINKMYKVMLLSMIGISTRGAFSAANKDLSMMDQMMNSILVQATDLEAIRDAMEEANSIRPDRLDILYMRSVFGKLPNQLNALARLIPLVSSEINRHLSSIGAFDVSRPLLIRSFVLVNLKSYDDHWGCMLSYDLLNYEELLAKTRTFSLPNLTLFAEKSSILLSLEEAPKIPKVLSVLPLHPDLCTLNLS